MGGSRGPHTRQQRQWRAQMKGNVQNSLYLFLPFVVLGILAIYYHTPILGIEETTRRFTTWEEKVQFSLGLARGGGHAPALLSLSAAVRIKP